MQQTIDSADTATEVAVTFLKKYYAWLFPLKATREKDIWTVEVDVGAFKTKLAKVRVNALDSSIIDFSIPAETSSKA
ncbi:MAG: hypothetical protein HY671_01890 [Chloroflexi bacterium]|nr:hypothetical protein [Chloroflexota bacterium]